MSNPQAPIADPSKPANEGGDDKKLPQLGALEEDDEFEEFPEQGQSFLSASLAYQRIDSVEKRSEGRTLRQACTSPCRTDEEMGGIHRSYSRRFPHPRLTL